MPWGCPRALLLAGMGLATPRAAPPVPPPAADLPGELWRPTLGAFSFPTWVIQLAFLSKQWVDPGWISGSDAVPIPGLGICSPAPRSTCTMQSPHPCTMLTGVQRATSPLRAPIRVAGCGYDAVLPSVGTPAAHPTLGRSLLARVTWSQIQLGAKSGGDWGEGSPCAPCPRGKTLSDLPLEGGAGAWSCCMGRVPHLDPSQAPSCSSHAHEAGRSTALTIGGFTFRGNTSPGRRAWGSSSTMAQSFPAPAGLFGGRSKGAGGGGSPSSPCSPRHFWGRAHLAGCHPQSYQ